MDGVIRRVVGRAVANVFRHTLKAALIPSQCGMQPDGCGRLHRGATMHMAIHKDAVLLSEDVRDAFMCINRQQTWARATNYIVELGTLPIVGCADPWTTSPLTARTPPAW